MLLIIMDILRVKIVVSTKVRLGAVRYDPKLPDDSGEVPKPYRVGDGSIPSCEIVSLLDGKPTRWSSASCVTKRTKLGLGPRVGGSVHFIVSSNKLADFMFS